MVVARAAAEHAEEARRRRGGLALALGPAGEIEAHLRKYGHREYSVWALLDIRRSQHGAPLTYHVFTSYSLLTHYVYLGGLRRNERGAAHARHVGARHLTKLLLVRAYPYP